MKDKAKWISILTTLFVWFLLYGFFQLIDVRYDSTKYEETQAYISELANRDVQEVSNIVHKVDKEILLAQVDSLEEELRIRFSDAVFIGDSIIEAIQVYDLLEEDHVVAARGRRSDNCEEDIAIAASLAPKQLFMLYGMNDLEYCRGDEERFAKQYREVLAQVKEKLPNTDIYVLSILPIQPIAIQEVSVYANYPAFNEALERVCEEEAIPFLDFGSILTSKEDYEFDGIHPKYSFYPLWLMEIAKEVGL